MADRVLKVWCTASLRREDGATAVEYALMVVMVALAIITTAALLGGKISSVFDDMATRF